MILEISLGVILTLLALLVVTQNKPLKAIIISGAFSASAAIIYFFAGAPDVAMAEASIGAVFTTFVYIVALKHSGKLKVGYINVPGLVKESSQDYEGVEYEILKLFSEEFSMTIEMHRVDSLDDVRKLEEFDIICGGIIEKEFANKLSFIVIPYLDTNIFRTKKGERLDLVRIKNMIMNDNLTSDDIEQDTREHTRYVFLVSKESEDIGEALRDFLQNIDRKKFDDIIRRNLG